MKRIALAPVGIGLALILYAFSVGSTPSSFDGGVFLAGGGLMLGGIVLAFIAVP